MQELAMKKTLLEKAFEQASVTQIDACWAVLKYKNIGILRKVRCISFILGVDYNEVLNEVPTSDDGRIYDKATRNLIHNELIKYS